MLTRNTGGAEACRPLDLGRLVSRFDLSLTPFAQATSSSLIERVPRRAEDPDTSLYARVVVATASLIGTCGWTEGSTCAVSRIGTDAARRNDSSFRL